MNGDGTNGGAPQAPLTGPVLNTAMMGMVTRPAVWLLMGPPKLGKTTETLYSLPGARYIGPRGGVRPALHTVGYIPHCEECETLSEARMRLRAGGAWDTVLFDDITLMVQKSVIALSRDTKGNERDPRKIYGDLKRLGLELFSELRDSGKNVILIGHSKPPDPGNPSSNPKEYVPPSPGQLDVPGSLAGEILKTCDACVLAEGSPSGIMHRLTFGAGPDMGNYVGLGDRYNVVVGRVVGNLGEILRMSGLAITRAKGLEWQEEWVEMGAQAALAGTPINTVLNDYAKAALQRGAHPDSLIFMLRDIEGRYLLRKAAENRRGLGRLRALGITI